MSEDPAIICEKCNTEMKRKITGGQAVMYRGDGWAGKRYRGNKARIDRQIGEIKDGLRPDPYAKHRTKLDPLDSKTALM